MKTFSYKSRQKTRPISKKGTAHILCTLNNTLITITDARGNTVISTSGGMLGFDKSRKSAVFLGKKASQVAAKKAKERGLKQVDILFKGFGRGRTSVVKGLRTGGLKILSITNKLNEPHGGCRPKKLRRILLYYFFY